MRVLITANTTEARRAGSKAILRDLASVVVRFIMAPSIASAINRRLVSDTTKAARRHLTDNDNSNYWHSTEHGPAAGPPARPTQSSNCAATPSRLVRRDAGNSSQFITPLSNGVCHLLDTRAIVRAEPLPKQAPRTGCLSGCLHRQSMTMSRASMPLSKGGLPASQNSR